MLETQETRLYYQRGPANGTPLVFVHGITDNGLCWSRVARALEADHEIVLYDARGHGSSGRGGGYGLLTHAGDLTDLVRGLSLDRPVLIGHSMGAAIVVSALAGEREREEIESAMRGQVESVNSTVEKHARIGDVSITKEAWTIQNEVLTPTLKIRRERVDGRFGELAQKLAREAAEQGCVMVEWA